MPFDSTIMLIILGLALGTYAIRVLPFLYRFTDHLSPFGKRVLTAIPPAALGALLIPGAATAIPDRPGISIISVGIALIIGLRARHIILPVATAIAAAYVLLTL